MKKNRWLIAASAVGIHLSIGSIYAYSAWQMPLENTLGWSTAETSLGFSVAIFFLGLTAAFMARHVELLGARLSGLLSAVFFSLGLLGSGLAVWMEWLWLFYVCFGVLSGIGLGIGYIAPLATLVRWFPERRGVATGMAIMGFGFGGLVCAQFIDWWVPVQGEVALHKEVSPREYAVALEAEDEVALAAMVYTGNAWESGMVQVDQGAEPYRIEVIYRKRDVSAAFLCLGLVYAVVMALSALYITPPEQYSVESSATEGGISLSDLLRSPAFYGLWSMLFINVTCGITVIATAKKLGYEMVGLSLDQASLLVMGISVFNGLGRIFWAAVSDKMGRPNTFILFFMIQFVAFPLLANLTTSPLAFMGVTFLILTCYGGGFATMPAYVSDLFGVKRMPVVYGLILTAWSLAGIVGPMFGAYIYERTQSYQMSLYLFGATFLVALGIAVLLKRESTRIQTTNR